MADLRVTQVVAEAVTQNTTADLRVTQVAVEVVVPQENSGTASVSTSAPTVAASGAPGFVGTAAVTLRTSTVSATGDTQIDIVGAVTTTTSTVSASGTVLVAGTGAVTTTTSTVASSGAVAIVGTASVTTPASLVAGAAQFTNGTASVTTTTATVAGVGAPSYVGTAAVTTTTSTVALSGGITSIGVGSVTTTAPTVEGYGEAFVAFPTTTYTVRRQRRAPYLSQEDAWLFHTRFELSFEAGTGLVSGQGSDPQLMLRWSDNGGHTWSDEHWTAAGKIGQYRRRAIWRRLGRSRKRLYEVTMSDPVKWSIVGAWVDIQQGTS